MFLPEFTAAVWVMPHRGHGYLVEIDSSQIDDGLPGGVSQSFKGTKRQLNPPQLLPEFTHREFTVSADQVRALIQLADKISYTFTEHSFTSMLGGSHYGLRMARGYQEATLVWRGRYEDQDESILELYAAIQLLGVA